MACALAWIHASEGRSLPIGMTARHLAKRAPSVLYSASRSPSPSRPPVPLSPGWRGGSPRCRAHRLIQTVFGTYSNFHRQQGFPSPALPSFWLSSSGGRYPYQNYCICLVLINRTLRGCVDMTTECVTMWSAAKSTPSASGPLTTPVAVKLMSSPLARSLALKIVEKSVTPASFKRLICFSSFGFHRHSSSPPRQRIAAAASTASELPPVPIKMSTLERERHVPSAIATSPSLKRRTRAPAARASLMSSSCRGRSSVATIISETSLP